ncbi:hypothetical protein ALC62_01579 [Cyphomyrmex costatus]|uniref:Uncharacterized protein n=1 Tax=Cyphomyrmex costatus TaxID=456900 RepID=A0A195D3A4_9HYME|nr:hypothetical protein ALC62_01579 [Cyphomyrmex costatus]
MPRCSNGAGVDNLTAFCGDQGMVNDYDGEDRQLRQAVGSRVERATRATLGFVFIFDTYIRSQLTRRKTCDKSKQFVMPVTMHSHKFRKKTLLPGRFRCTS